MPTGSGANAGGREKRCDSRLLRGSRGAGAGVISMAADRGRAPAVFAARLADLPGAPYTLDMNASPYAVPPAERIPCACCAVLVHERRADYSAAGDVICFRCADVADIGATEERAVQRMKAAGYGNLGLGALALVFNPLFLFSILAIANASILGGAMARGDWYRRRMGYHFTPVMACAVVGGVFGGVPLLLWIMVLGALGAG